MRKIGIMGGTFNPIHNTHILIAQRAYSEFDLDEVWFMPSKNPPHKQNTRIESEDNRINMINLAIKDYSYFKLNTLELKREGLTYTSDTLRILGQEYPDDKFYFIIGGDSLKSFSHWHEPMEILQRAALIVTGRGSINGPKAVEEVDKLIESYSKDSFIPQIFYLSIPTDNISSEGIRQAIACEISVKGVIPPAVEEYIYLKGLYKNPLFEAIKADLKASLTERRYKHVIGVAQTAYKLAKWHGYNPLDAYTAGLLHDCTKYYSAEEQLTACKQYHIRTEAIERKQAQNLLHSKTGAAIAKDRYQITDKKILDAIYYHTTGRPRMTKLDKILYLSDSIEPNRTTPTDPDLDVIRATSTYNLDLACFYCMRNTCEYLLQNFKDSMCMTTLRAYEYYKPRFMKDQEVRL